MIIVGKADYSNLAIDRLSFVKFSKLSSVKRFECDDVEDNLQNVWFIKYNSEM